MTLRCYAIMVSCADDMIFDLGEDCETIVGEAPKLCEDYLNMIADPLVPFASSPKVTDLFLN